jgi:hypothetical protein
VGHDFDLSEVASGVFGLMLMPAMLLRPEGLLAPGAASRYDTIRGPPPGPPIRRQACRGRPAYWTVTVVRIQGCSMHWKRRVPLVLVSIVSG